MAQEGTQPQPDQLYTVDEYFSLEAVSDVRHEYVAGEMVAMGGASPKHNRITANLARELGNALRGKECEPFVSDMRVKTREDYRYPDVVVVCEGAQFEIIKGLETLVNPTVIIEVLSKSSEADDRGDKFFEYRSIVSLKDYLLISQDKMRVEHYTRQPNDEWILHHDVTEPDGEITIQSIGCQLKLTDLYERVEFPPPSQLRSVKTEGGQGEA
ncbi:MAG: Uma2 family endonuclease [Pyrinomonadaceae bacterium]|jgi:Uma2 family endonuclease|nr:Uma2 family endonuclease [Pyrinomonadaceae bacterium]